MEKKILTIIVFLLSFLLPLLAYSAKKNPSGNIYTLSWPNNSNSPCSDVCKNSFRSERTPEGKFFEVRTLCGVYVQQEPNRMYCIERTITSVNGNEIINERIVKED